MFDNLFFSCTIYKFAHCHYGGQMDYLKCIVANRFTLAGCVLVVIGFLAPEIPPWLGFILVSFGGGNIGGTHFGIPTLIAYRRTKADIARRWTINGAYLTRYKDYCGRCGVRLAAKEAGIQIPAYNKLQEAQ